MRLPRPFAALILLAVAGLRAEDTRTDVVVYGATPGGVCAAVAAAREGASVLLIEPTAHVGGVNTGGLCFSDSNQTVRATLLGLFEEWHRRVEADYAARGVALPYSVSVKDQSVWTYEPQAARRVTDAMLKEAGVRVLTRQRLRTVEKEGARLTALVTDDGAHAARVFVDATYEGDLMAASGVYWTIGREGRDEFNEPLAGRQYPKPLLRIDGFGENKLPLPLITSIDPGVDAEGERSVMVYSFRLCVTKDPANRVPFPEPAAYDPARFELLRRYFKKTPNAPFPWDLYPLPGGKLDANNGIGKQFSMGLVGGANGWCSADEAARAKIWEEHRQYTLEFYKFITTDPAVPARIRDEMASLGLCRDEFAETGHWSPQLYVREGRRMQGRYVLSQKDVLTEPAKEDAIMVSSFPIDSHDCRRLATPEGVLNEGTIFPVRMPGRRHGYPYQVPYRAITPLADECDNLLVPVALSATHVAYSSVRVEPTWMALGQSAGVAAALAAKLDTKVQSLPYPKLRERLLAQKQVLDLPTLSELPTATKSADAIDPALLPGVVLDDVQAKLDGPWEYSASFKPHVGTGYAHDGKRGDGQCRATFRFQAPADGRFAVRMAYSPHPTRAHAVPVVISTAGRAVTLSVDQTVALPAGEAFRRVGVVDLTRGAEVTVTVSNTGTDGFVILDALQFVPLSGQ